MDYPDDDLDLMIDEELELERELDLERGKENRGPSPPALHKAGSSPRGGLRPTDTNVGIGADAIQGKRARGQEAEAASDEEFFPPMSPTSPAHKKLKTSVEEPVRRLPRLGERKVFLRVPEGEFQAVTAQDGSRFYLRMAAAVEAARGKVAARQEGSKRPVGLCGQPFHTLRQAATVEMTRLATASLARYGLEEGGADSEQQTELWVEKFKPKCYTELLSDNGTNRTLLLWLKLWDKLVFNKERKVKKPLTEQEQEQAKWKTGAVLPDVMEEWDSEGRPQQRVALLHGPPGLGKTTLAHIVARHAGYKVVEMNASDDRSVDAFKKNLESATQMRSVISEDRRPNCLVIDEIDGAPAATINLLVSVLSGAAKAAKKSGSKNLILRPVICICNELYSPALRPLRNLALIVPFPPTLPARLAGRLREITAVEQLKTDLSALLALCKKTDNDIRSCLSTLQFFRKRGQQLRTSDVASAAVGSKDATRSLFSVWESLFTVPRPGKVGVDSTGLGGEQADSLPARYKNVLAMLYSSGEYEKLVAGVFENYHSLKFRDSGMRGVVAGMEWLVHFDLLHNEAQKSQAWALMGHFCFPLVATHLLWASTTKQRISFPSQQAEVQGKLQRSGAMLEAVTAEMEPTARAYSSGAVLLREVLPTILSVIQPSLRPVNTQLFSAKEKAELANVVSVHIAYNITYQQERNLETGQYEYRYSRP